ncbi:hypothetical protein AB2N04_10475 [Nitratireductor sp. GISD-1A_MAKvit]|uniref:DUF7507 domain-containing protein n=1 Tax=Nitratireductor sp. GISD-1A_MAKvit TaxID=3234198 RepID=UPI0034652C5C
MSTASGSTGDGNFLDQIQLTISPLVEFLQQTTSHAESGTTSNLPRIRLSGNLRAPISVMVSVVGGTAVLNDDFTTPSGTPEFTVNIPAGTYSGQLFNLGVTVIEDAEQEEDETIEFEILPGANYRLSSTRTCGADPFQRSTHTILEESVEITKTGTHIDANGNGLPDAGETLSYDFVVSNTGSVDLSQISVADLSPQVMVTGGPISLAAGASNDTAFKGTYTLTQADVDAGRFENQASVSGRVRATGLMISDLSDDPDNPADVDTEDDGEPDDPTILELPSSPAYTLEKSSTVIDVNGNGRPDAGDKIDYTFTVENTGNVTLSNITVSDAQVTFSNDTLATLAPGPIRYKHSRHLHDHPGRHESGQDRKQRHVHRLSPCRRPPYRRLLPAWRGARQSDSDGAPAGRRNRPPQRGRASGHRWRWCCGEGRKNSLSFYC